MTNKQHLKSLLKFDTFEQFKTHQIYFDGINLPLRYPCWGWIINYELIDGQRRPFLGYFYNEKLSTE